MAQQDMLAAAHAAVKSALGKGAQEASARTYRVREVEVKWRDGSLEKVHEATTRGLGLTLYVDGRYSNVSTSDLRPEALETFIGDSVTLTRALAKDPFRTLPDPKLYEGQAKVDLLLEDPKYATVTPEMRRAVAKEIEAAARAELDEAARAVGGNPDRRQEQRHQDAEDARRPLHSRPLLDNSTAIGRVPGNCESTIVRIAVIGTARNAPGTPHNSDHTARLTRMANGLRLSELPISQGSRKLPMPNCRAVSATSIVSTVPASWN